MHTHTLVYAGDKEKTDSKGRQAARPIVVGMAMRRICGRIPCAQLKDDFARLFSKVRQLGVSVPGGLEIAWLSTEAAIDRMGVEADETAELLDMPVASQMDCAEAFPNAWRSELFANTEKLVPELLRYTLQCYEGAGQVLAVQDGCIVKQWKVTNGVWQGDPLGGHHMVIAIYNFCKRLCNSSIQNISSEICLSRLSWQARIYQCQLIRSG